MTAVQIREKKQTTDKQYTLRTEGNVTKISIDFIIQTRSRMAQVGMHDEIFHFEIFENFVEILKYFKAPSLKYFRKYLIFSIN